MSDNSPTTQERLAANLVALEQGSSAMAASVKSSAPAAKEKPVIIEAPVLVVRGK